jgi:hypothetical protein
MTPESSFDLGESLRLVASLEARIRELRKTGGDETTEAMAKLEQVLLEIRAYLQPKWP